MNQDPVGIYALQVFLKSYWNVMIMIIIAPLIIQIIVNVITGFLRAIIKIDPTPIIRLIAFPGTLFRIMLMYFTLGWLGWKLRVSHGMAVGGIPTSIGQGVLFQGLYYWYVPSQ